MLREIPLCLPYAELSVVKYTGREYRVGATDPVGYTVIERPVHPHDLHATILHAFGVDQRELYYEHHNRREIVTFNGGEVVQEMFG